MFCKPYFGLSSAASIYSSTTQIKCQASLCPRQLPSFVSFIRFNHFSKEEVNLNFFTSKIGNVGSDLIYRRFGEDEAEGNNEVEWKQHSLFPAVPVIECFVIPSSSNLEKKNCEEIVCFKPAGS